MTRSARRHLGRARWFFSRTTVAVARARLSVIGADRRSPFLKRQKALRDTYMHLEVAEARAAKALDSLRDARSALEAITAELEDERARHGLP